MSERHVDSYFQLGNNKDVDASRPADDDQRIDLDEFFSTDEQTKVTSMVTGVEQFFATGRLSRQTAQLFNLANVSQMDPIASAANARLGGEGFISSIIDGFKKIIETIIKYIKMAITWISSTVKTLLGFQKTERQVKEIEKRCGDMHNEFVSLMRGLGFPEEYMDIEKFIGELPNNLSHADQVILLKNRLMSNEEAIKALIEATPLLIEATEVVVDASSRITKASAALHDTIRKAHHELKGKRTDGEGELNRIGEKCAEVNVAINYDKMVGTMTKLVNALNKTEFTEEELKNGFEKVRQTLNQTTEAVVVNNATHDKTIHRQLIADLNKRFAALQESAPDLSKIDFQRFSDIVTRDDAEVIRELATQLNKPQSVAYYQETAQNVNRFTSYCHLLIDYLNKTRVQMNRLCQWYYRSQAMLDFYILGDLESIIRANLDLQKQGLQPHAHPNGVPISVGYIQEADVQTLQEKISFVAGKVVGDDALGFKKSYETFLKQMGWK